MNLLITKQKFQGFKLQMKQLFTKDKNRIKTFNYIFMLLCLMIMFLPAKQVKAATIELKVDGVSNTYSGKEVNVIIDEKKVNMKGTPGIVINGTSYVSYKNVFGDSKFAKVSYDSKKKTITIQKYDKTLVMALGSKHATINDETVTMPAAPIKVTYVAKKTTKILVPTEFVAKTLGYEYSWSSDASSVTAKITSKLILKYDGKTTIYTGTTPSIIVNDKQVKLDSTLPAIIIDRSVMVQAKKVFTSKEIGATYSYNKEKKTVTIKRKDIKIVLTLGSKTAKINDKKVTLPTPARIIKNVVTGKSYVCVPAELISKHLGFYYKWNNENRTSTIVTEDYNTDTDDSKDNTDSEENTDSKDNVDSEENNQGQPPEEITPTKPTETPDNPTAHPDLGKETVFQSYSMLNKYYDTYTKLSKGIYSTGFHNLKPASIGMILDIQQISTENQDREVYEIKASSPFSTVTSDVKDTILSIQASNMLGNTNSYPYNNDFLASIQSECDIMNSSMIFTLCLNDTNLSYDLQLSADLCTLTVTIYANYIEKVDVGTNAIGEYIRIRSLKPINPEINVNDITLSFIVNNTMNTLGDLNDTCKGFRKLLGVHFASYNMTDTLFIIDRALGADYIVTNDSDGSIVITFPVDKDELNKDESTPSITPVPDRPFITGTRTDCTGATAVDLDYTAALIPLPKGITVDQVTNVDDYMNQKIKLYVPGDATNLISTSTIHVKSDYVKRTDVTYENGKTVITFTTSRICGFDYLVGDGILGVAIERPKDVFDKIVVLDPGHGGSAIGAIGVNGVYEKVYNLKILYTLMHSTIEEHGIKAYYTRTTDVDFDNYDRAALAAKCDADMFLSLHMNSASGNAVTASGVEVYYYSKETASKNGLTGKAMATALSKNLSTVMKSNNRGAKASANLIVLKQNTVPAVLMELGFLSNSEEIKKIASSSYQQKAADTIASTIAGFFDEYPTGR